MIEVSGVRSSWDTVATNCGVLSGGSAAADGSAAAAGLGSATANVASMPAGWPPSRSATTDPRTRTTGPATGRSRTSIAISGWPVAGWYCAVIFRSMRVRSAGRRRSSQFEPTAWLCDSPVSAHQRSLTNTARPAVSLCTTATGDSRARAPNAVSALASIPVTVSVSVAVSVGGAPMPRSPCELHGSCDRLVTEG